MFPTFAEFRQINNDWRDSKKKPHQNKLIIAFYYPFALIGLCIIYAIIRFILDSAKGFNSRGYRNSRNYKKVIKEGIFFDTIEYHER